MVLQVGLIGCGGITRPHVDGWNALGAKAHIVAVADLSAEAAQARVEQIGYPVKIYSDYHDLLADPRVEAVDIALPHHLHRDAIVAAALAGKHLMTEKPLCLTLEEAADIAAAVKKGGIRMMAAHNQIFFPAVQQAKNMILQGDLGRVHMVYSADAGARRNPLNPNKAAWGKPPSAAESGYTWRSDPAKMGGGELIDTGYHPTYRLLFLAGQKVTEVAAVLGTYRIPMDREDTANVIVKFADGAMGQIYTSWGIRGPMARPLLFAIMGETGQLWGEPDKLYYQPVGMQTPAVTEYAGWNGNRTFAAEIAHFADAIEKGYEPLHSVAEATETLRVILAGYRSAAEKIIVQL